MSKNKKKQKQKKIKAEQALPSPPVIQKEDPLAPKRNHLLLIAGSSLLVCGIVLIVFLQIRDRSRVGFGACQGCNVLLITIDTLRADHLPVYGYTKIKTPNIDKLAGQSLIFRNAVSQVPSTLAAHTSIMTGMLPTYHGVRDNGGFFVAPQLTTIAEILKEKGYRTAGFVSSYVLNSRWQINQGFDSYFDVFNTRQSPGTPGDIERPANETEVEAERWLANNKDQKFFAWIHYYDPHEPYEPPEPYKSRFATHPYDGEIAFTDEALGKLLTKMEQLQMMDHTLIVLTSDHGESLGEHGELTHGVFLYNATLRVPLLMRLPKGQQNNINGIVSHIDIAPTILEWLGFKPIAAMQGKSLIPLIKGKEKEGRTAYSESYYAKIHYGWSPLESITSSQYRFIKAPKPELYDIQSDPKETTNLIQNKKNVAQALSTQLESVIRTSSRIDKLAPQLVDAEAEEKLRALGYISTIAPSTSESLQIDPKDKIYLHRAISQALTAINEKKYDLVIQAVTPILQEDPGMTDAHFFAGIGYTGLNQYDKAIPQLLEAVRLRPDHLMALHNLASNYERLGKIEDAEHWFNQVLKYDPKNVFANTRLANIYLSKNQPERAKPYYLKAAESYEKSLAGTTDGKARALLHSTLGEVYFRAGEAQKAEEHLKAALAVTPQSPVLHYNLAQIYEEKGDLTGAVAEYKKVIEIAPNNFRAFNNLGLLYRQLNQLNEAVNCFQKVIQLAPQDPNGYWQLATTYQKLGRVEEANQIFRSLKQSRPSSNH